MLRVTGRAGKDYPMLGYIPETSFSCELVAEYPGYYADMDAACQVSLVYDKNILINI